MPKFTNGMINEVNEMVTTVFDHICTPSGFFQLIMAIAAISGVVVLIKRNKLDYTKPKFEILESYATAPAESNPDFWKSLIHLSISNQSNFENTICFFRLFSLRTFCLIKPVIEKEVEIKLPATSKTNTDISLNFEDVKNLRDRNAILVLTDLKGSKIMKKFKFMPSYDRKKIKKASKQLKKTV